MKGKNIDGKINNKETWNSGNEEWENEKKIDMAILNAV